MAVTSGQAAVCALHRVHTPANLTVEWHHVIPVAWQLHTPLAGPAPFPGQDPNGRGMLWDSRGVSICPTGHRNVHWWIVKLMHAAAAAQSSDPTVAYKAVKPKRIPAELTVAQEALTRFMDEAGNDLSTSHATLLTLVAAGEWGEA